MLTPSLGLILCPMFSHKGEGEWSRCKFRASHLSDQIFLFHLKFCFIVNDVDRNFSQPLISLMGEHLTNANEQMLISFFNPTGFQKNIFEISACNLFIIFLHTDCGIIQYIAGGSSSQ